MEWALIIAALLALPAAMYFLQDRLLFHPRPVPETTRALIAQSAGAESLFIRAADGTRLHAWYLKGSPLILYFGGNAEEVSWMLGPARRSVPGAGWLLVDYRGYGSSEGSPSESGLIQDALQWYALAKGQLGAQEIFLFGRSLGSGIAVQVAARQAVDGVIAVAPYDSMASLGQHHYPFLPVRWMLKHPLDSVSYAPAIGAPLLCLVAGRDEIIPVVHSKRLFDAWKGPKRWVELAGAGHNSTDDVPAFWQAIREFLVQPH